MKQRGRIGTLGVSPSLVSRYCEGYTAKTETARWADSGHLQFWSEPAEILNLRSCSL